MSDIKNYGKKYHEKNKEIIKLKQKEYREKNKEVRKKTIDKSNYKRAYKIAKWHSTKRGHEMLITEQQYNECRSKPCAYCGNLYFNGVDRVDSNITYTIDNIVSCCTHCNIIKMDYSVIEFLEHVYKISNYQRIKQTNPLKERL